MQVAFGCCKAAVARADRFEALRRRANLVCARTRVRALFTRWATQALCRRQRVGKRRFLGMQLLVSMLRACFSGWQLVAKKGRGLMRRLAACLRASDAARIDAVFDGWRALLFVEVRSVSLIAMEDCYAETEAHLSQQVHALLTHQAEIEEINANLSLLLQEKLEASKEQVEQMARHVATTLRAEEAALRHRNAALAAEDRHAELNKELEEADKERDQLQEHAHSLRQELELVKLQLSETVEEMKEKAHNSEMLVADLSHHLHTTRLTLSCGEAQWSEKERLLTHQINELGHKLTAAERLAHDSASSTCLQVKRLCMCFVLLCLVCVTVCMSVCVVVLFDGAKRSGMGLLLHPSNPPPPPPPPLSQLEKATQKHEELQGVVTARDLEIAELQQQVCRPCVCVCARARCAGHHVGRSVERERESERGRGRELREREERVEGERRESWGREKRELFSDGS